MTSSTRPIRASAWALALACLTLANSARANGAFPQVSQLVVDPSDEAHLALRSNFGLIVSSDGGKNWDWLCEAGLGYSNTEPPIAIVAGGVILVGVSGGVRVGDAQSCDFVVTQDLGGDVDDLSTELPVPGGALALTTDVTSNSSQVWETLDSGSTWHMLGTPLDGFIGFTIDMAREDPNRIYLSGLSDVDTPLGLFGVSNDRGATWTFSSVPGADSNAQPYIAAIQPNDEDTVYVRLTGPGVLQVTHDAGKTFTQVLSFSGDLEGFAVSPDGATVLASSPHVGMFRATAASLTFEQLSCSGVSTLSWTAAGLIGSGSDAWNGFLLGQSQDEGQSFDVLLTQFCIRGPLACAPTTSTGSMCPNQWSAEASQLGQTMLACDPSATAQPFQSCPAAGGSSGSSAGGMTSLPGGGTGALSSAGGAAASSGGNDSSAGRATSAGSGGAAANPDARAGSTGATVNRSKSSAGCAFSRYGTRPLEWYGWFALLGTIAALRRRRTRYSD